MAWREHQDNALFSANTNYHPAFGVIPKVERNRRLTSSIMRLNYGMSTARTGRQAIETTNDPLKRKPEDILFAARVEASIAGRMRGNISPRAPGQVKWKYPYWAAQRPPVRQPIGPFTQGSLERQSILYRMSDALGNIARGGK